MERLKGAARAGDAEALRVAMLAEGVGFVRRGNALHFLDGGVLRTLDLEGVLSVE